MLFTDGDSSVSLTVAESAADFNLLLANQYPQPVGALHPFVPKLAPTRVEAGSRVGPVMALQITVFPNSGICIGSRLCHVSSDGRSFEHFMKFWALVCKGGGDIHANLRLPSHDRAAIKDPDGVELTFLKSWWSCASTSEDHVEAEPVLDCLADKVRATFVLSQVQIDRLKRWVTNNLAKDENSTPFQVSSFVASCALLWVCLAKSKEIRERNDSRVDEDDDEPHHFIFGADCRSRLAFPLPTTYFGNCVTVCYAPVNRKVLLGDNGVVAATKAIGREVGRLEGEALKEFEKLFEKHDEITKQGKYVSVSGSTKLGFYEVDFGWGKPKNVEFVHIEESNAIGLVQSRDEKGGVELSVTLSRDQMSCFSAMLKEKLAESI